MHRKLSGKIILRKFLLSREFFVDLNSGRNVPFPGVLDIGQFHSPQMKPCKSPDYFIKVSFHIVMDMRQGESNIFQVATSKAFLSLKTYLLWKIRPISVKRWKPVWILASQADVFRGARFSSLPTEKRSPLKTPAWEAIWIRACPIVLLVNLQQLAIVRLDVSLPRRRSWGFVTCSCPTKERETNP